MIHFIYIKVDKMLNKVSFFSLSKNINFYSHQELRSSKKMSKPILSCSKCSYFPVSLQVDKYFLNSDTFKCPVCQELNLYDKTQYKLLESQYYYCSANRQTWSSQEIECQVKETRKLNVTENDNSRVITIFVQICDNLLEGLYLNPINSELRNNFNIDKTLLLNLKRHPFFNINDHVIRQRVLRSNLMKTNKFIYGTRRVSKIQHLCYSIDCYIQKISEIFLQQEQTQSLHIVIKAIQKKQNLDKQTLGFVNSFTFNYQTYRQYKEYYSLKQSDQFTVQSDQFLVQNSMSPLRKIYNENLKQFELQTKSFLSIFYKTQSQKSQNFTAPNNLNSLNKKTIALFSNSFDQQLIKEVLKFKEQKQNQNSFESINHFSPHYFYFQDDSIKNEKQHNSSLEQTTKKYKFSQMLVNHSSLYIPHCKSRLDSKRIIQRVIKSSILKDKLNNQSKVESISILSSNNKNSIKGNIKVSNKDSQKKDMVGINSSPIESHIKVFVFWRMLKKDDNGIKFQNDIMKSSKISVKSYVQMFQQPLKLLSDRKLNDFHKQILQKIKAETLKIIAQHQSKKQLSYSFIQIIIDRIFCSFEKSLFYYVFDFDKISNQIYEELDYLGESTLPEYLRGYAKSYEKSEIKNQNPFKKTSIPVFLVKSSNQQQKCHESQDDSESVQSL